MLFSFSFLAHVLSNVICDNRLPFTVIGVLKVIQNSKDITMGIRNLEALVFKLSYEYVKTYSIFWCICFFLYLEFDLLDHLMPNATYDVLSSYVASMDGSKKVSIIDWHWLNNLFWLVLNDKFWNTPNAYFNKKKKATFLSSINKILGKSVFIVLHLVCIIICVVLVYT